jgi:hypothetical protein
MKKFPSGGGGVGGWNKNIRLLDHKSHTDSGQFCTGSLRYKIFVWVLICLCMLSCLLTVMNIQAAQMAVNVRIGWASVSFPWRTRLHRFRFIFMLSFDLLLDVQTDTVSILMFKGISYFVMRAKCSTRLMVADLEVLVFIRCCWR